MQRERYAGAIHSNLFAPASARAIWQYNSDQLSRTGEHERNEPLRRGAISRLSGQFLIRQATESGVNQFLWDTRAVSSQSFSR